MPTAVPLATQAPGNVLTSSLWNAAVRDNINKLLDRGHRVLTVAQFAALTGLEGTKGVVAPDEVYLEVDSSAGVQWHLVYESGEPTYKWRKIGGPPLYSEVLASETTTSGTYVALTTGGPSIALPRAGDYDVTIGADILENGSSFGVMSYDIGATPAADADFVELGNTASVGTAGGVSRLRRKTGIAASTTLTAKYKSSAAAAQVQFRNRYMLVDAVRLI